MATFLHCPLAFCLCCVVNPKLKIFAGLEDFYKTSYYRQKDIVGRQHVSVDAPQEHRISDGRSGLL
jgi:hypothetical protein